MFETESYHLKMSTLLYKQKLVVTKQLEPWASKTTWNLSNGIGRDYMEIKI